MNIEKLIQEKYLYPIDYLKKPSEYWKCYRTFRDCKIYVQTNKSFFGKDRPSDYYLYDTNNNKLYSVTGRIGGIAGFIRLLESKPTDFAPIEILKLARDIKKQHDKNKPTSDGMISYYCGKLSSLEELARRTNNLDIADEIKQLI